MHKQTEIRVLEEQLEFYLALSNSEMRDLHPDDAKEAIVQELRDMADKIEGPVIITPEITRSGVYRVRIDLKDARRSPF